MKDSRLININQLKRFLKGTEKLDLSLRDGSIEEKYTFIDDVIDRTGYKKLRRSEKRVVINYLKKFTGYKRVHEVPRVNQTCLWQYYLEALGIK